jgi:two-component system, sensor histidine kinase and response regulator
MLAMTALLDMTRPLTPEQQEYVSTAHVSAETLLSLLNDILDFSKIEAGKLEMESTPFCLPLLVTRTVKSMSAQAAESGAIELVCDMREVPLYVVGDSNRLRQVLCNLLSNAIKFTKSGHVLVGVNVVDDGDWDPECRCDLDEKNANRCRVRTPEANECVVHFTVADTGIGIPRNKRRLVFESFSQVDGGATTRKYGGTGLGLASKFNRYMSH